MLSFWVVCRYLLHCMCQISHMYSPVLHMLMVLI